MAASPITGSAAPPTPHHPAPAAVPCHRGGKRRPAGSRGLKRGWTLRPLELLELREASVQPVLSGSKQQPPSLPFLFFPSFLLRERTVVRPCFSYRAPNIADAHHERALNPPSSFPLVVFATLPSTTFLFIFTLNAERRTKKTKNNRARSAKFTRVCRTGGEDAMAAPVKAALALLILTVASKFYFCFFFFF